MRRPISIFFLAAFITSHLVAQTTSPTVPMPKDPAALLQLALAQNDIDVAGMKPWHMKAAFQLYDPKGNQLGTINLEEIWAGAKQQKRIWTSPSFNQVEIVNEDGTFRNGVLGEMPLLLQIALRTMVHPMPSAEDIAAAKLKMHKGKFGTVKLNCIDLEYPDHGSDSSETHCFDLDEPRYITGTESNDAIQYAADNIGTFQNRSVATQVEVHVFDSVLVRGSITDLHGIEAPDPRIFVPTKDEVPVVDPLRPRPSEMVKGCRRIDGSDPVYPPIARAGHIPGHVLLSAIIGEDGRVQTLRVESSTNDYFSGSAINAVHTWRYQPCQLHGAPQKIEAVITVNFAAGLN